MSKATGPILLLTLLVSGCVSAPPTDPQIVTVSDNEAPAVVRLARENQGLRDRLAVYEENIPLPQPSKHVSGYSLEYWRGYQNGRNYRRRQERVEPAPSHNCLLETLRALESQRNAIDTTIAAIEALRGLFVAPVNAPDNATAK